MLAFITDENISHAVAEQLILKRPEIEIHSVLTWEGGRLRNRPDAEILQVANDREWTFVTYDQKTVPPILVEIAMSGRHHGGVVFVDRKSISASDIGSLIAGLISLFDLTCGWEWKDRIVHLNSI